MFEGKTNSIIKVVSNIVCRLNEWHKEKKNMSRRVIRPLVISELIHVGFFDGAAQEGGLKCGVGAILRIDKSEKIK